MKTPIPRPIPRPTYPAPRGSVATRAARPALAALVALGALAGCAGDFAPRSRLDAPRVLAVVADPLEVGPGETVTLRPVVHLPAGVEASYAWRFCPLTLGPSRDYACAIPACEVPLPPLPGATDGRTSADPSALAASCLVAAGLEPTAPAPSGEAPSGEAPDRIDTRFLLTVTASDGTILETVASVPLYPAGAPAERNRPPAILAVELDGVPLGDGAVEPPPALAAGASVPVLVRVDPASLDRFVDAAGRERTEEPIASFYATGGRFEDDRGVGLDAEAAWEAGAEGDAAAGPAWLTVVVRDLRGGQAVAGPFEVQVR